MATGTQTRIDEGIEHLLNGFEVANGLTVALFGSGHTPAPTTDSLFSSLTGELATGNGYTAGGQAVTGLSVTNAGSTTTLDFDDVVWTASGGDIGPASYAYVYDPVDDRIVTMYDFSGDPQTATDGNTFTVAPNASGVITA